MFIKIIEMFLTSIGHGYHNSKLKNKTTIIKPIVDDNI